MEGGEGASSALGAGGGSGAAVRPGILEKASPSGRKLRSGRTGGFDAETGKLLGSAFRHEQEAAGAVDDGDDGGAATGEPGCGVFFRWGDDGDGNGDNDDDGAAGRRETAFEFTCSTGRVLTMVVAVAIVALQPRSTLLLRELDAKLGTPLDLSRRSSERIRWPVAGLAESTTRRRLLSGGDGSSSRGGLGSGQSAVDPWPGGMR